MYQSLLLPDLRMMLQENDSESLHEFCQVLHPASAAETLEGLTSEEIWRVLSCCDLAHQVEIFEFMSLPKQVELVDALDRERLSRLLEAMSPDNRADLLSRLDPERVDNLLPLIAKAERADIRKLLSYPADSAGSIMTTEYAFLPEGATVSEALQQLRHQAPDRETIYYIYVVDDARHLKGFVSLRDLILARPTAHIAEIMTRDVISVRVDDDQEHAAQQLDRYDFIAIPVVDNQNRLVGIITYDDVLDVLQEEATEDVHRLGGMAPLEDSYLETPIRTIAWKRGIWLMVLAGLALVTARLVEAYERQAQSHLWLVSFLPLVLASGGNAGSQSATLVIRALALGQLTGHRRFWLLQREFLIGVGLGVAPALVAFCGAWLLRGISPALVVTTAVFLVVIQGAVIGAMLPLAFKRLGMDPAIMSNPLIAAMSDALGVVIYFSVAVLLLRDLHA